MKIQPRCSEAVPSAANACEAVPKLPRRRFMLSIVACAVQPVPALAGEDAKVSFIEMAFKKPCEVVPGLASHRYPEWICRNACKKNRALCLESVSSGHRAIATPDDP